MAGLFITFEGIEGCGKSTQVGLLADWFNRQRYNDVVVTREPGGTAIGDNLRNLLLDPDFKEMTAATETLMYAASRAQLVSQVIRPALQSEKVVICDRYIDSTLAYQVWGRGLDFQTVVSINEWATGGLIPDLTFLLRVSAELGLGRAIGREPDRLEQESLHFHRLVEAGYEELAVKYIERFVLIDARDPISEVHKHVVAAIKRLG